VPGWLDMVNDKYDASRSAYVDWASAGKPRSGYLHQAMCRTRADFKLAMRHCKAAEEQLRADARPRALACKQNPIAFWKGVKKDCCKKASVYANKVGDSEGAYDVCKMWQQPFSSLYNSLDIERAKQKFFSKVNTGESGRNRYITVLVWRGVWLPVVFVLAIVTVLANLVLVHVSIQYEIVAWSLGSGEVSISCGFTMYS